MLPLGWCALIALIVMPFVYDYHKPGHCLEPHPNTIRRYFDFAILRYCEDWKDWGPNEWNWRRGHVV